MTITNNNNNPHCATAEDYKVMTDLSKSSEVQPTYMYNDIGYNKTSCMINVFSLFTIKSVVMTEQLY